VGGGNVAFRSCLDKGYMSVVKTLFGMITTLRTVPTLTPACYFSPQLGPYFVARKVGLWCGVLCGAWPSLLPDSPSWCACVQLPDLEFPDNVNNVYVNKHRQRPAEGDTTAYDGGDFSSGAWGGIDGHKLAIFK
jgi:hypothetical protein